MQLKYYVATETEKQKNKKNPFSLILPLLTTQKRLEIIGHPGSGGGVEHRYEKGLIPFHVNGVQGEKK